MTFNAPGVELYLRLTPHPPQSVYSAWTLNVGGREASLSGATVVQDNGSVLRFDDFYPSTGRQRQASAPRLPSASGAASGSCGGTSGASGATAAQSRDGSPGGRTCGAVRRAAGVARRDGVLDGAALQRGAESELQGRAGQAVRGNGRASPAGATPGAGQQPVVAPGGAAGGVRRPHADPSGDGGLCGRGRGVHGRWRARRDSR